MAKLAAQEAAATPHRRRITFWNRRRILSAASAAAVVAIGIITVLNPAVQEKIYSYQVHKSAQQIYIEESEIMQMLGEDELYMINNLKSRLLNCCVNRL